MGERENIDLNLENIDVPELIDLYSEKREFRREEVIWKELLCAGTLLSSKGRRLMSFLFIMVQERGAMCILYFMVLHLQLMRLGSGLGE